MAIKYYERYPQRWESPSQDYPQGAFKNLSALGEQDGSYLEKDWLNDQSGFFGALLRNAEMTPNGLVDTAQKSQFYDALIAVANKNTENYFSTRSIGTGKFIREGATGWLNSTNTVTDKNGVVHSGSEVTSDTLVVSDLVSTVEQGIDKPVTSWGVFKALKELENNIKTLEIPVDQIFYFDSPTPPQGYIARNGQAINESTMPKLFARYGANMPDDRDRVHRMTGTLAGAVGTTQEDAIRNITGNVSGIREQGAMEANGAFYISDIKSGNSGAGISGENKGFTLDASLVVPTAAENRVKSRIIIACNKIQ